MSRFRGLVHDYGLTEPQWRVLRTLGKLEQVEMSDLAEITALLFPSLSRIIRDLEARDLVRKVPHAADQRRYLVSPTETGQRVIEEISPDCERVYSGIRQAMGAEKLKQLNSLLLELEERLDGLEPDEFSGPSPELRALLGPAPRRGRPQRQRAEAS